MGRAIYTPENAERMKARAGAPYRPSNGDEGFYFQSAFCQQCKKDNFNPDTGAGGCRILVYTMAYDVKDADYPKELVIGKDGQPTCTAFNPRVSYQQRATAKAQKKYAALPRDPETGRPII